MRSAEERLIKMHERAAEMKRQRYKAGNRILVAVSSGLMACLVILVQNLQSLHHAVINSYNTGSSLLSDSVGGYVLIALIAFFIGVILTVLIIRRRKGGGD